MRALESIREELLRGDYDGRLCELYLDEGMVERSHSRYAQALERFSRLYPEVEQVEIYSAPGRSEVCGNHTDHQKGRVLAASINLDAIAVAAPSDDHIIHLVSDDFPRETIDLSRLDCRESEKNTTTALIRGVAAGLRSRGYRVDGMKLYMTSDVLMGAGMSSSAAFESLLGTVISGLYNQGSIPAVEIAQVGQYAENVYFGKPCGLMDQMACSVGGMVTIDFEDRERPQVRRIHCDFSKAGLSLCIVDTQGSHADLTPDYAAIPREMCAVARALGKECLREVEESVFYEKLDWLRSQLSDRAVLRALHFFREQERVAQAVAALEASDYQGFLDVIRRSGDSSSKYLQNIYSPRKVEEQAVTVALGLSEALLGAQGACRVHGGGFAGTIQAFVPTEAVAAYQRGMEAVFQKGSCHVLQVRPQGGVRVL